MNVESLQSIMLSIAEARSLPPIFDQVVRGIAQSSDVALVRLWLIQSSAECPVCREQGRVTADRTLHLRGSTGSSRAGGSDNSNLRGSAHRFEIGERKIGQIAASGSPMLIKQVTGDESWVANPEWIRREGIQSFAGQPLVFRGETLGVLAVFSRATLSDEEMKWLRTFADHAAVAIANARAFEELDRLKEHLERENEYLNEQMKGALDFGAIVGESAALRKVLEQVTLVADTQATVLIQGETGTGKELVARAIHEQSKRRNCPFVKVNCGAIPEELFESEFFGHVKGAFTGAIKDRIGRFELADGGDLFLDEVAEIPLSLQVKLLRVLQEKQFERLGDTRTRTVDARVIAATNRNLKEEVERGRFREDLFYRLTVFPIEVPPLEARKEDIPLLAQHFIERSARRLNIPAPRLTRENQRELQFYHWPGNIRELENVVERATILARGSGRLGFVLGTTRRPAPRVSREDQPDPSPKARVLTREDLRKQEATNLLAALEKSGGKIFGKGGAAELLGMRPTTLASRLKAFGLKKRFPAAES